MNEQEWVSVYQLMSAYFSFSVKSMELPGMPRTKLVMLHELYS